MEAFEKLINSRHRTSLYGALTVVLVLVASIYALSNHDRGGQWPRLGLVFMTIGAAMWLPRQSLLPGVIGIWLVTTIGRSLVDGDHLLRAVNAFELVILLGLAAAAYTTRISLRRLEQGNEVDVDPDTGVQAERYLVDTIEKELARSRRFERQFSVMIVGIDPRRLRFDYRDEETWQTAFKATGALLANTRANIDRVFRFGEKSFALVLPETGPNEVTGMIRRLNRLAKSSVPGEGEPGGPLPMHIGVTFYPQSATAADDLIRRAEVAVKLAERSPTRVKYDGAEAPDLPAPELLRRTADDGAESDADDDAEEAATAAPRKLPSSPMWLGSYVDEEEDSPQPVAIGARTDRAAAGDIRESSAPAAMISVSDAIDQVTRVDEEVSVAPADTAPIASVTPLRGAVADLLKGLDEALDLIQGMKSA